MFSKIKSNIRSKCIITFLLLFHLAKSYAQLVYPVDVQFNLFSPLPVYLEGYTSETKSPLDIRLQFNDLNDPSIDVYLRISIENINLKISNPVSFRPSTPITLTSGISTKITNDQLSDYLRNSALSFQGKFAAQARESGILTDGIYTIKIEAFEYNSRQQISSQVIRSGNVILNDPPRIIFPKCQSVIPPSNPQRILFNWTPIGGIQATTGSEYKLFLYELSDPNADPKYALYNNKAFLVYQSDFEAGNSLLYDISLPQLEAGKVYIYQIQARDLEGKAIYKNDGKSEVCWFRYGYPGNGYIEIVSPLDQKGFSLRDLPELKWNAPDNKIPGQPFVYEVKVVTLEESQSPESALATNNTFFEYSSSQTYSTFANSTVIRNPRLKKGNKYTWQVKAYSGDQEVAKSDISTFFGPQKVSSFSAGGNKVEIISLTEYKLDDLAGKCKFHISRNKTIQGNFKDIGVEDIGGTGSFVMKKGTITLPLNESLEPIEVTPQVKENGQAYFYPDSIRMTPKGLFLGGIFKWDFPHATSGNEKPQVKSNFEWVPYNYYRLNGAINIPKKENGFGLTDPKDFFLELNESSRIFFNENTYDLELFGKIILPEDFVEGELEDQEVSIPFYDADQLYYLVQNDYRLQNDIRLVPNTQIILRPTSMVIDLSEGRSPPHMVNDQFWKGVYFSSFEVETLKNTDASDRISFRSNTKSSFTLSQGDNKKCWLSRTGLQYLQPVNYLLTDSVNMYTFPALAQSLSLTVENSYVKQGKLQGSMLIPFFDVNNSFDYQFNISNNGFTEAELLNIEGQEFKFNVGKGDQEVWLSTERILFEDKDHIDAVLSYEWPNLPDSKLHSVPNLHLWGDYKVGFDHPNGTHTLENQKISYFSQYPILIETISVGSETNAYGIALKASILLGDDISGANNAPSVNLYTTLANKYAPTFNELFIPDDADIEEIIALAEKKFDDVVTETSAAVGAKVIEVEANTKGIVARNIGNGINDEQTFLKEQTSNENSTETNYDVQYLNSDQQDLFNQSINTLIGLALTPLTSEIQLQSNSLKSNFNGKVDELQSPIISWIEITASNILDDINSDVSNVNIWSVDLSEGINSGVDGIKSEVIADLKSTFSGLVDASIREQGIGAITTNIDELFVSSLHKNASQEAQLMMLGNKSFDGAFKNFFQNAISDLTNTSEGLISDLFDLERLKDNLWYYARKTVNEYDFKGVVSTLGEGFVEGTTEWAQEEIVDQTTDAALDAVTGDEVGADVDVNFVALFDALKDGDIKEYFKTDHIYVSIDTERFKAEGYLDYFDDDPRYGDMWEAILGVEIDAGIKFESRAHFKVGRKEETAFWMADLGVAIQGPANPVQIPPFIKLVGVKGVFAKHMNKDETGDFYPDENVRFRAALGVIFFDVPVDGILFRMTGGWDFMLTKTGFSFEIAGDIQSLNIGVKTFEEPKTSFLKGSFRLGLNTDEGLFYMYASVKGNTLICINGEMVLEIRANGPSKFYLGTRESPLRAQLSCMGPSVQAWLQFKKDYVDMGAELDLGIHPRFKIGVAAFNMQIGLDVGVRGGFDTKIGYRPISIKEVGIFVEAYAKLWAEWQIQLLVTSIRKRLTFFDILVRGELRMRFDPRPATLSGKLSGHVKILGIGVGFKAPVNFKMA